MKITLPFWLSGPKAQQLAKAADGYWARVAACLRWPLGQLHPHTCAEGVLDLLAWQRNIERFADEPLALYRTRVAYAFVNAQDAGSVAGFQRIAQRLGIGYIEIRERLPGEDWDIVAMRVSDQRLWQHNALLRVLIKDYGRTCRRYRFESVVLGESALGLAASGHSYLVQPHRFQASAELPLTGTVAVPTLKNPSYVLNPPLEAHL